MYYYHLNLTLYSLKSNELPSNIFDTLPPFLIDQETLDLFDKQAEELGHPSSHKLVDNSIQSVDRHQLYPRKRQPEKLPNRYPKPNIPPTPSDITQSHLSSTNNTGSNFGDSIVSKASSRTHDDFRLGPIDIECIDKRNESHYHSKQNKGNNGDKTSKGNNNNNVNSTKPLTDQQQQEEQHCKMGYGIIHLLRDEKPAPDDLMPDMLSFIPNQHDMGTITCTLAVPTYMTTNDFLVFVKPFDDTVMQYRFIRDAAPNKYMVLMKFKNVQSAYHYRRKFNGRQFHGMEPEICHIVFIASVTTWNSTTFDNNNIPIYPMLNDTLQGERNRQQWRPHTLELPTCPVCMERMDESVTGLLGIMCQHSFDCGCLGKWGDGNCHICRFSEKPVLEGIGRETPLDNDKAASSSGPKRNHQGWLLARHAHDDRLCCYVCGATESLWICMICGHIGCGRYQDAHAYDHYMETNHLYALEIDTQRVWDYVGDGYVHRLIQNTVDGKLVEFPGSTQRHDQHDMDNSDKLESSGVNDNNVNNNIDNNNTNNYSSNLLTRPITRHRRNGNIQDRINTKHQVVGSSSSGDDDNIGIDEWPPLGYTGLSSSTLAKGTTLSTSTKKMDNDLGHMLQEEKLEAMSMEYTTLLTSQLESQRIYYEDQLNALVKQLSTLTAQQSQMESQWQQELDQRQRRIAQHDEMKQEYDNLIATNTSLQDKCQLLKEKYESARTIWEQEKKMTNTLSSDNEALKQALLDKKIKVKEAHDELRDLTFFVQARNKVQDNPDMAGGSVGTIQRTERSSNKNRRGKKGKK
ncbi:uncharacterized protein BX664DRAFT_338726 [Halteromyces radiatus]|uniref:uncharacterized protein n=1 Tax=Halteromyces radiatus TaxID=101107 RepID=UPI00222127C2|nr:uncharacterized protein BX664DRAFT_338726 [Halteromyces radiatus]KAI8085174.1 hypothetical protein BX664DRAFT_338726 [Halteromyces radiatus]